MRELYQWIESERLLATLDDAGDSAAASPTAAAAGGQDYQTILDWAAFETWLERLQGAELLALDTETTSLDYMRAELVGLSFAVAPGQAAYLPLAHDYPGAPEQLDRERVLERMRPLLEDPERPRWGRI